MSPKSQMPTDMDLLWPTLKALENSGGSASVRELSSQVATDLSLPDEILDVLHSDGPQTEIDYRAGWARTSLKRIGAIHNTARGVWTITDRGRDVQGEEQVRKLVRNDWTDWQRTKKARDTKAPEPRRPTPTKTRTGRARFSTFFEAWRPTRLNVSASGSFENQGSRGWR